jgi:hypothetical protein
MGPKKKDKNCTIRSEIGFFSQKAVLLTIKTDNVNFLFVIFGLKHYFGLFAIHYISSKMF